MDLISIFIFSSSCVKALFSHSLGYHTKISKFIHLLVHVFFYTVNKYLLSASRGTKSRKLASLTSRRGCQETNVSCTTSKASPVTKGAQTQNTPDVMWTSKMPPGGVGLELSTRRAFQTNSNMLEATRNTTTAWAIQETAICPMSPEQRAGVRSGRKGLECPQESKIYLQCQGELLEGF